jgi:hypothetical protein
MRHASTNQLETIEELVKVKKGRKSEKIALNGSRSVSNLSKK